MRHSIGCIESAHSALPAAYSEQVSVVQFPHSEPPADLAPNPQWLRDWIPEMALADCRRIFEYAMEYRKFIYGFMTARESPQSYFNAKKENMIGVLHNLVNPGSSFSNLIMTEEGHLAEGSLKCGSNTGLIG